MTEKFDRLEALIEELYQYNGPEKKQAMQMADDLIWALYNNPDELFDIHREYSRGAFDHLDWTERGLINDLYQAIWEYVAEINFS